jgi:hypothetical protein
MISKPNIQIGDEVREMSDEEYKALLASGWTMESTDETPSAD